VETLGRDSSRVCGLAFANFPTGGADTQLVHRLLYAALLKLAAVNASGYSEELKDKELADFLSST